MSTTVDQRVVEMRFDNKQFESGVSTTMSSLDKLKKSLDLKGASKGLEDVNTAARKCDLSSIGESAEKVGLKFNALYSVADQVFRNITNSAMVYGKRIVSAFTVDPIKTGFSEYETQINAVQTILANTESKGTTLNDVNSALDELNTYADKTIYNFTEMTRNIGTFTAAGVDLDTSVTAIQGIANLAAVSGSTSQQASTAMYQLSQALSSGTVKLMDWNSVVNAGMGGQVFQDALKSTARAHGIAIDDIIAKNGSFRESLSDGWLTSEILTDTLKKFTMAAEEGSKEWNEYKETLKSQGYTEAQAEEILKMANTATDAATKVKTFSQLWDTLKEAAQSGWTQTWEILVGDFEEAKELLTSISDTLGGVIGKFSESRNEMLENWKTMGGRTDVIEGLKDAFTGIVNIIKPISEAFREIFPPLTAEKLLAFSTGLKNLGAKFKEVTASGGKFSTNLKRIFKGIFATFEIGFALISATVKIIGSVIKRIGSASGGLFDFLATIADYIVKLSDAIKFSGSFAAAVNYISDMLGSVVDGVLAFGKAIIGTFTNVSNTTEAKFSPLVAIGEMIKVIFTSIGKVMAKITPSLFGVLDSLGEALGSFMEKIAGFIQVGDFESIFSLFNGGVLATIGIFVAKFMKSAGGLLDNTGGFLDSIKDILGGVSDAFGAFAENMKAAALQKIAIAIAILAGSLLVLSLIDSDKLALSLAAISALFVELMWSMSAVSKITAQKGLLKIASAMIGLSTALLILAIAMKIVSSMSWEELTIGLTGTVVGLAALAGAVRLLPENNVKKAARAIKTLSTALVIFALAMKIMGSLSWSEMTRGLIATAAGTSMMVGTIRLLPKDTGLRALGLMSLATSIVILASALKIMGSMSWSEIGVGLTAMATGTSIMVGTIRLLPKDTIIKTLGILSLATALVILASALKIMGSMSMPEIGKSLLVLAGALVAITVAVNKMSAKIMLVSGGMVVFASALLLLSGALMAMGGMSMAEIGKGLLALGGAMTIVAIATKAMKSALPGAAAMLIVSAALLKLATALIFLGSMSIGQLVQSLIGLAAALTIIGVAGKLLSKVAGGMLSVAWSLMLFGTGVLLAGVGLQALGSGITAILKAVTLLGPAILELSKVVVEMIPLLGEIVISAVLMLCDVLIQCSPTIIDTVLQLVADLLSALVEYTPTIVGSLFKFVLALLDGLVQYTPMIVERLFQFLVGIIDSIAANLPDLIQAGANLLMAFFTGVIDAMSNLDYGVLVEGIKATAMMAGLVAALAAIVPLIPLAMIGVVGIGAVVAELSAVLAAIGMLSMLPGLQWLVDKGASFMSSIGKAIGGFVGSIVGGIAEGISDSLPQIGTNLSEFMANIQPFIDGAKSIDESVVSGVKSLIGVVLAITGASFLEGITSWITGGSSIEQFSTDIIALGNGLKGFSDAVMGIVPENMMAAAAAGKALAEMTSYIPNEGGVASWFAGENSISKFAGEIVLLGQGLKGFSDAVAGIAPENIVAAANAGKVLAEMTSHIPNEGGVASWFAGENSISKFAGDIVTLGVGLKGFSDSVAGVNPETVTAAANSAKVLAEMTQSIPEEGGIKAWFSGESSISKFAGEIVTLGRGLKGFSDVTAGVNPETTVAAANAAKALADMTGKIPNEGGIKAWFAGESSISKFATDIISLGKGLKGFSDATAGINPESTVAAANAAKALAEMTNKIPNEGGVVSWFTGDNSLSKFSKELPALGKGLKGFSDATTGVNPETMTAAANSAKTLAEMTESIPNEGGIKAWFTGESSISNFSNKLPTLGKGIKGFSDAVKGVVPENITSAANAAKALAEMTAIVPKEGGIKAWFTGESSISNFAGKLPALGKGLKGFSEAVTGIVPENVTSAANAAKTLAQMTDTVPKNTDKIISFGDNLSKFGSKLASYFKSAAGISSGSITSSNSAIKAIKDISAIDSGKIKSISKAIDEIVKSLKNLSKAPKDSVSTFKKSLSDLGKTSVTALVAEFDKLSSKLKKSAKAALDAFIDGVNSKKKSAKNACSSVIEDCAEAMSKKKSSFKTAGKNLVQGFADGISANSYKAEAKAKAMAEAAAKAAKEALDINSPSKIFMGIGSSIPEGMAMGIDKLSGVVNDSAITMAVGSIDGVKKSISRIADVVNSDIDAQPTIRPVLDLSDVRRGTGAISRMFDSGVSMGVLANVGAIGSMMDLRNQNGINDDVVSAIEKLGKDVRNSSGDTYNFGDISYGDESSISEAVQALVRAAIMDRRV